jgi:hypothetical protein
LSDPQGLAFNSAGDLFEADANSGNIYEFTPGYKNGDTLITYASGLAGPIFLAFQPFPKLKIASTSTNTVLISWPAPSTGFVLEQNPALGTTNWSLTTNNVSAANGNKQVVISPTTDNMFFQLVNTQ